MPRIFAKAVMAKRRAATVDGTSGAGLSDKIEAVRVDFAEGKAAMSPPCWRTARLKKAFDTSFCAKLPRKSAIAILPHWRWN